MLESDVAAHKKIVNLLDSSLRYLEFVGDVRGQEEVARVLMRHRDLLSQKEKSLEAETRKDVENAVSTAGQG